MVQPGGGPWTQSTNNIRPDESGWMVDGVINASFYDARPVTGASSFITDGATILPIDAIQEFNLEENPKAEYGWKPGAVVNVGIRSGTNTLHGAAYAFGRDQSFDARNVFNPAPDTSGNCGQPSCAKLPLTLEQFGGVVGGPIKKDKLFFFAGYEGMRSFIGNAFSTTVPALGSGTGPTNSMVDAIIALQANGITPSPVSLALFGCPSGTLTIASKCTGGLIQGASATSTGYLSTFPNTNTSNNGIAKLDYHINSKHVINGMLWIGRYTGVGEDHPMVNSAFDDTVAIPNWTVVGNWVWTPNSAVVNELRLGYTRNGQKLLPADRGVLADGTGYKLNTGVTNYGGFPSITISGFGAQIGSWRGRPVENGPNPFYDLTDSVSYLLGKHSIKFGGEYAHIETDSAVHDTRGRIDFLGKQLFCPAGVSPGDKSCTSKPLEDLFAGLPGRGFLLTGSAVRTMNWMDAAGFVQDDWRLTSRLIVNLGLRYSYTSPFHEAHNLLGGFDPKLGMVQLGQASVGNTPWKPDYKDFSPRLGFAWDVSGKGTTVVRAGASIIYSSFAAASFLQQAGLTNFTGGSIGAIPTGGCKVPAVGAPCPAGQTFGGTIDLGTVNFDGSQLTWNGRVFPGGGISCTATSKCNISAADPNLKTPYVTNWNLSVTHAFTNNLSLEVGYVGNRGTRLTGFIDLNQIPASSYLANPKGVQPYAATFPYLNYINWYTNDGYSNYNSLQTTLTKRVSHGFSFTAGYTYGHGLDNGSENRFGPLPQDSTNPRAEYASGDFDVRHRLTFTTSYEFPGKKGFGQLLEGWKINSIVSAQSAQPWNIADQSNNFTKRGDKNVRWDFFGNPADFKSGSSSIPFCGVIPTLPSGTVFAPGTITCTKQSGIDSSVISLPTSLGDACTAVDNPTRPTSNLSAGGCFVSGNSVMTPPDVGKFGNMGRNIFRDNGFRNWDLSIFKTFTFKERLGAQFRFEVFDVLNRATISNPNGANNGSHNGDDPSNGSGFGDGAQTPDFATGNPIIGSGGNRAIQLGLKLTF
jgi:hypothetical protein